MQDHVDWLVAGGGGRKGKDIQMTRSSMLRCAVILLFAGLVLSGCSEDKKITGEEEDVCSIEILAPGGHDTLKIGQSLLIAWNASTACGENVLIELFHTGEAITTRDTLAHATENDGEFAWIVAACTEDSSGYGIALTDLQSGERSETPDSMWIVPPPPCVPTVLTPNGEADRVEVGDVFDITWKSEGSCGDSVKIQLLLDGAVVQDIVASMENTGLYAWHVEPFEGHVHGYRIRIVDLTTEAFDESDADFSIHETCSIVVTYPVGDETWAVGDSVRIEWESSGECGESVKIELIVSDGVCLIASGVELSAGYFDWKEVFQCDGDTTGYRIRVTDLSNDVSGQSGDGISIWLPCTVTVTSPNGGEELVEGEACGIAWEFDGACGNEVAIELLKDDSVCKSISETTVNPFEWIAERCGEDETGYKIRVTDVASGASDESDLSFSILGPCIINVTSPGGGEEWAVGDTLTIAWDASGSCGDIFAIELLHDGEACHQIAETTDDSAGSYPWVVMQCDSYTTGYQIRISDSASGMDATSQTFSIAPLCEIKVLFPNGYETFIGGELVTISWSSNAACGDTVDIELLRSGAVCSPIAEDVVNSGEYAWVTQQCDDETGGYQIRITDSTGLVDESDGPFSIRAVPCVIEVTLPTANTAWTAGTEVTATWEDNEHCGDQVNLDLFKGDVVVQLIAQDIENAGTHTFILDDELEEGGDYRLQVNSTAGDDYSESFTIHARCRVVVTMPDASAEYVAGDSITIVWEESGACGDEVDIALYKAGAEVQQFAQAAASLGTYAFVLDTGLSDGDDYRVRVANSDSECYSAYFTIHAPCSVEVTSPNALTQWISGENVAITWSYTAACSDTVGLQLYKAEQEILIIVESAENMGIFVFDLPPGLEEGNDYRIRIVCDDAEDFSEYFTVLEPCTMEVTEPTESTTWTTGEEGVTISWDFRISCGATADILLYKGLSTELLTIAAQTENDGEYSWDVPDTLEEGSNYMVWIVAAGGNACSDYFTIRPPSCEMEVTVPFGGTAWEAGQIVTTTWTYTAACGDSADLFLCKTDTTVVQTIALGTENDGEHEFELCGALVEGADYRIRVVSGETVIYSEYFTILEPGECILQITSPDATTEWMAGGEETITWDKNGPCHDQVELYLYKNDVKIYDINPNAANTGEFTFIPPVDLEEGNDYQVKLVGMEEPLYNEIVDYSDYFTIHETCEMTVIIPADTTVWIAGETVTTIWEDTGFCGDTVGLYLYKADTQVQVIADSVANSGSYEFDLEATLEEGDNYRLQVLNGEVGDYSDCFTIHEPCIIEVLVPNAGTEWEAGQTVTTTWSWDGFCGDEVDLYLYKGIDPDPVQTIIEGAVNEGAYEFTLDAGLLEGDDYTLSVVIDEVQANSESFTIHEPCVLNITSPAGTTVWTAGENVTTTWEYTGFCGSSVDLYLYKGETQVMTIVEQTPNDGTHPFDLDNTLESGADYRVCIVSGEDEDYSEAFTINGLPCEMDVVEPNASTTWVLGQAEDVWITWEHTGFCGYTVDLKLKNTTAPWIETPIVLGTDNDGSHSFQLDEGFVEAGSYWVWVVNTEGPVASEVFSIQAP